MPTKKTVHRPFERIKAHVVNQSDRTVGPISLIVLHDTESHDRPGVADLAGLRDWFNNPKAEASAHVGVDAEGYSARFVADGRKAWACAGFNSASLNIEIIGFAAFKPWQWNKRVKQMQKTAKYIAYWSKKHDIPIRKGKVDQSGHVLRSGVVTHKSLGLRGGGHVDPGKGYPFHATLVLARRYRKSGW